MSDVATRSPADGRSIVPAKLAIWWLIASEVMVFAGALAAFLLYRATSGGTWNEPAGHLNDWLATVNTLVLLASSYTMAMAFRDRDRRSLYLDATVGLGLLFLVIKAIEYSIELGAGYYPDTGEFWSFYYFLTAVHALHVLAGIVVNATLLTASLRGHDQTARVQGAGLYWHFVDVVWIFLFPLLYLSF